MQTFDLMISFIVMISFTIGIIAILHNAELKIQIIEITDQKYSDYCNIAYISNYKIQIPETEVNGGWCLANEFFS